MLAGMHPYDELAELVRQQAAEIARLKARIADLEEQLRQAHRQTAPFRRRDTLKKPDGQQKKPGRPPGHPGAYRQRPDVVDQEVEVPLDGCPHCQRQLTSVEKREQFLEELPPVRPVCVKVTRHRAESGCVLWMYTGECPSESVRK